MGKRAGKPPLCGVVLVCAAALCASAAARTLTITATFKYRDPDGNEKPVRWALCELRDEDRVRDNIIATYFTDESGTVAFQYDSEMDDGLFGGRVDPYVRCYCALMIPGLSLARCKARVKDFGGALEGPGAYCTYYVNTQVWDGNNQDRSATTVLAEANRGRSPGNRAPMALTGPACAGCVDVLLPHYKTVFASPFNEIWVQEQYQEDFDAIVHEYGHHEMYEAYGRLFGDYDERTQSEHNFTGVSDDWTAFCEAWADFCPAVTKGYPLYHGFDVENPDPNVRSAQCEGCICRIFWDLTDTLQSQVVEFTGAAREPVDRPATGPVVLDDDPFGFCSQTPYAGLPGLSDLKAIIANVHPKSLSDFTESWNRRYTANPLARRAYQAVLWQHGVREGINNNAPRCTLTVEGNRDGDAFSGPLTLKATVTDADVTAAQQPDAQLMHVVFYWARMPKNPGDTMTDRLYWTVIVIDVDVTATPGQDGSLLFECRWPTHRARPTEDQPICISAVASDFFATSDYSLKAPFTDAQLGPVTVKPGPGAVEGDEPNAFARGAFKRPRGITIDGDGNLYVADCLGSCLKKYDANGNCIGVSGSHRPRNEASLYGPEFVALDVQGNVYVTGGSRVVVYDADGNYLRRWPRDSSMRAKGIAVGPAGEVYVSDQASSRGASGDVSANGRVQVFDEEGRFLRRIVSGRPDGKFYGSSTLAVDAEGNVYVSDPTRYCLQKIPASYWQAE